MSSIIEQNKQSEYEIEWFNFLHDRTISNINVTNNQISFDYTKEFRSFIIKKAKHYIKDEFSSWRQFQVSRFYSKCVSHTDRDLLIKDVICLAHQFFTWKKEKDDETNKLIVNTATKILQEKEELESIQARLKALRR